MDDLRGLIVPPETEDRGNKKAIMIIGGIVVLVLVVLLLLQAKSTKRTKRVKDLQDRPVAERELTSKQAPPRQDLRYKSSYSGVPLQAPDPTPALPLYERPTPQPADLAKPPLEPVAFPPFQRPPPPEPPLGLPEPPPAPEPPRATGRTAAQPPIQRAHTQPREKKPKTHWLETETKVLVEKPPFPLKDEAKQAEAGQSIFPKAVWARPKHPEQVLYQDQLVQGILMGDFHSDIPGPMRVLVTQEVGDRWGQGYTLIPQYTVLIGQPDGRIRHGQTRVPGTFKAGIFPDGTGIEFDGKLGDRTGAMGMPGDVNNHVFQKILGIGATALLSIGARVPFGSPGRGQNQPNLAQEFSQDVAQGLNQAGQQIVQQQLMIDPTITQTHGYAVSVSFTRNINFMSAPIIVSK